jgi:hypothetical protein
VLHSACTHRRRVDSWLLVVESQTASLTPGPSFTHNLCCRCPNGSCEAIFDIYTSRPFQWYKEHIKARCFDPWNWVLNFWDSRRTPKSPFRECECHLHTPSKWGCDTFLKQSTLDSYRLYYTIYHRFFLRPFTVGSFDLKYFLLFYFIAP